MKWVVRGNGDVHEVDVEPNGDGYSVEIDGRHHPVELVCLDGVVASLRYPADGRSLDVVEVTVERGAWGLRIPRIRAQVEERPLGRVDLRCRAAVPL